MIAKVPKAARRAFLELIMKSFLTARYLDDSRLKAGNPSSRG
jgi:hypothetical protein